MQVLDTRELGERDGFNLVAYKVVDEHSSTEEADCYDEDDVTEYKAGHWSFVGVVVKASLEGIELGEAALWGVEDGYLSGAQNTDNPSGRVDGFDHTLGGEGYYNLTEQAITDARITLVRLRRTERIQRRRWPRRSRVACW